MILSRVRYPAAVRMISTIVGHSGRVYTTTLQDHVNCDCALTFLRRFKA